MDYYVFNENNCWKKVTDEHLNTAFLQKDELPVHIIAGMGASKAAKYLPRLKDGESLISLLQFWRRRERKRR